MNKQCIIDRFEGKYAVVEYGDMMFNLPKELLPHVREGDVIEIEVVVNQEETENQKKKVNSLLQNIFKNKK